MPFPNSAAPEGHLNPPAANRTRAELVGSLPLWTASQCDPDRAKANCTTPRRLNANLNHAPLVCNVSRSGVGCKAYRKGTTMVRFGSLSTRARECSHCEPPWNGSAWHGIATYMYGSLQKALERDPYS